jgi:diguanylate cyclase (GGDEF)-like protein/PAS domain S-box-containing protein
MERMPKASISKREAVLIEAMDNIPAAFVVYDKNDQLIACNAKFREFYGYSESDTAPGVTHQELGLIDQRRGVRVTGVPHADYMESRLKYRNSFDDEQVVELPDGRLISTRERPITSGGFVSIQIDVTDTMETQAILEYYATTDELTGLTNRRVGLHMMNKLMAQHKRSGEDLSISYVDIDGLKAVNDEFGHIRGDWTIRTISNAIKESIRESDIVMRLGGDEFLIIFSQCTVTQANTTMESIKARLAEIEANEKIPFALGFSYGTAAYQQELLDSVEVFIGQSDRLMYQNKLERNGAR